ncbi:unnamed protein product [Acanthoscelides obtectus]|uniref:Uncharacterized protein n=1 Tax=Acanthoscelides obtectus TaxID=200917 RepID=A0A9P0LSP0_ACAOB|nr:unnamed protein product [Acanthoscelides obtectus]CAK1622541.1 hypothetical protein AOBTE_LOCUS1550 [Acanthoscelides obtectus]
MEHETAVFENPPKIEFIEIKKEPEVDTELFRYDEDANTQCYVPKPFLGMESQPANSINSADRPSHATIRGTTQRSNTVPCSASANGDGGKQRHRFGSNDLTEYALSMDCIMDIPGGDVLKIRSFEYYILYNSLFGQPCMKYCLGRF